MSRQASVIGFFAHHKVAANLVMILMLVGGLFAVQRMNVQFFPNFALDIVTVRVVWSGASAEDVENGITEPLEQRLKSINNLYRMSSTSAQGIASITLEFREGSDPVMALDEVRQQVDEFRNLPKEAEKPQISRVARYDTVARVLLSGDVSTDELRRLAWRYERELTARGIDRVDVIGLPKEEISIEIPAHRLESLGLTIEDIGNRIARDSTDLPAGLIAQRDVARELRALEQRRTPHDFADLPLLSGDTVLVRLGDVATIRREARPSTLELSHEGKPAVELLLQRAETGHSLKAARIFEQWVNDTRPTLPPNLSMTVYDEAWQLIDERIDLLIKNGLGGLVLVVLLLYLFLPGRVAFWVAFGIPSAFLAALAVLYGVGGSINMMSLFALIMALGVIVDDAIVVGEDAYAHYRNGESPLHASEGAGKRMLWPVLASSLTTVAAFLPLMMVGGIIGNILFDIPLVMICVILASLIECFLVLPAHLRTAFLRSGDGPLDRLRARFDAGFEQFRDGPFRRLSTLSVTHRGTTLSIAAAVLILAIGLLAGGRLNFTFFPTPEAQTLYANATFVAGTPRQDVERFLGQLETTLAETEQALGGALLHTAVIRQGGTLGEGATGNLSGDQFGSVFVELSSPDRREVRNSQFIDEWKSRIVLPPGLESFTLTQRQSGPPGKDINVRLTGHDPMRLKAAAENLAATLRTVPGVTDTQDDMPYGRDQLIFSLTPAGRALGLSTQDLGRQLRAAYDGQLAQIFQDGPDEIEVRVRLPREDRERLASLADYSIRLPDGRFVPLASVAQFRDNRGFEALRHAQGLLAVEISAEIDRSLNNANNVRKALNEDTLPRLARDYGIAYSFEGRAADQRETMEDMRYGLLLGLALIYIVLAWVFASWGWPLVVMAIIPFGLVGAIFGHWIMGIDLTILSLFGLFGLSGIVVNNAIILVSFFKEQRHKGLNVNEALVQASCLRLRAVLLTSLTTIGGLAPLLFERSLQAQFLIPMATSIAFGLAVATVLVLFVIPALLSLHESLHTRLTIGGKV
ncbi:MAG: efflux RND transporter permease subunit [Halothiobacillaceae bacterium]|nr:efflux RND transporter permease subunit [Halothiobacillaceae bacterium]